MLASPTIVLPGFGDQFASGARMKAWNVSLVLQRHTLTAETFAKAVRTLVDDQYHLAIIDRLKLLHDLSETEGGGARRAARLIATWLRTGYTHLNVLEHDLPFLDTLSMGHRAIHFVTSIHFKDSDCYISKRQ